MRDSSTNTFGSRCVTRDIVGRYHYMSMMSRSCSKSSMSLQDECTYVADDIEHQLHMSRSGSRENRYQQSIKIITLLSSIPLGLF